MQAAGRNFAAHDDFGTAEKVSLEVGEAHITGLLELVRCFQLFGQHFALRGFEPMHQASPFLGPCRPNIDFNDVGKLAKRGARVIRGEVIERDEVAKRLQPLAGRDDTGFRLNRLQNLGHGLGGREQGNQVLEKDLPGAIHEGKAVIAKRVDAVKQGAIQCGAGCKFRIGVEIVFDTVAEQKLISENVLRPVQDWLAGHEALSR